MGSLLCTVSQIGQCIEGMAVLGSFLAAPSSYIKLVRAVYRQRIYYYLVQFSGMLHCWLQRYHARIRTLGSSLVHIFKETKSATMNIFRFFFYFLFKSFVKVELRYAFTMNLLTIAENCTEK